MRGMLVTRQAHELSAALALLALGLVAGCAGLSPMRPPPSAAARPAPPTVHGAVATAPGTPVPAGTDSSPSSEALAVLGTIPEPLSPAERVPAPAEAAPVVAPAAAQSGAASATDTGAVAPADSASTARADSVSSPADSTRGQVPIPAPTQPLGERPGADGRGLPDSVLVPTTRPPPAPATGAQPDTCWRLQVGAPPEKAEAEALESVASSQLLATFVIELEKKRYKVRTRDCMEHGAVLALRARAEQSGFKGTFVIKSVAKEKKP